MRSDSATPPQRQRRNYLLFIADGGLFIGALNFTNHQTVLPSLILEQNGPGWVAALAPGLMVIGMFAAPIFTHRWVDRMQTYHRFTSFWFFMHRALYLVAAWLLFQHSTNKLAVVTIIALTPFLSGILGGIPYAAWQQLFMSAIPSKRRPSNLALRFLTGGVIGVIAGKVIQVTLANHPGPEGYAYLHLWAAGVAMLSWVAFAFIKEEKPSIHPPLTIPDIDSSPTVTDAVLLSEKPTCSAVPSQGNPSNTKKPATWQQILLQPELRQFWIGLILMHFLQILSPFYAVAIRHRFNEDLSFLGILSIWQMTGYTLGNLSAGFLGDRLDGKWVFRYGMLMFAITLTAGVFAPNALVAKIGYFAFGFFLIFMVVGKDSYILETAPSKGRSLFLSMASFVSMLCMVVFSFASYFIWTRFHSLLALALPVFVMFPLAFFITGKKPSCAPAK